MLAVVTPSDFLILHPAQSCERDGAWPSFSDRLFFIMVTNALLGNHLHNKSLDINLFYIPMPFINELLHCRYISWLCLYVKSPTVPKTTTIASTAITSKVFLLYFPYILLILRQLVFIDHISILNTHFLLFKCATQTYHKPLKGFVAHLCFPVF